VLPVVTAEDGEALAMRIATDFLDRIGDRTSAVIGIGPVAGDAPALAQARISAVRVLRDGTGARVARLMAYDEQHDSTVLQTLDVWLDAFGDVMAGSARLCIHPNTFRYRLRRISEVGGIDLESPKARFAAMLQLRLLAPARRPGGPEAEG
jgi:hypothetical protein